MVHIRMARDDEIEALQNLNNEIFIDNQKYDSDLDMTWATSEKGKEYFTSLFKNPENCCFIAETDGKKVGYITAGPRKISYRKSRSIEIDSMGVIPEYQSKGIGKLLIEKCFEWAKQNGFQKAYVNSYFENTGAIKFYKRNGFSEIDLCLERPL